MIVYAGGEGYVIPLGTEIIKSAESFRTFGALVEVPGAVFTAAHVNWVAG